MWKDCVELAHDGVCHAKTSMNFRSRLALGANVQTGVNKFYHRFDSLIVHQDWIQSRSCAVFWILVFNQFVCKPIVLAMAS